MWCTARKRPRFSRINPLRNTIDFASDLQYWILFIIFALKTIELVFLFPFPSVKFILVVVVKIVITGEVIIKIYDVFSITCNKSRTILESQSRFSFSNVWLVGIYYLLATFHWNRFVLRWSGHLNCQKKLPWKIRIKKWIICNKNK